MIWVLGSILSWIPTCITAYLSALMIRYVFWQWRFHNIQTKNPQAVILLSAEQNAWKDVTGVLEAWPTSLVCTGSSTCAKVFMAIAKVLLYALQQVVLFIWQHVQSILSEWINVGQSKRLSPVLREPSRAVGLSNSTSEQRVVFVEHSNGSVRTESYYYDPKSEPTHSMRAMVSVTPEKSRPNMANSTESPVSPRMHNFGESKLSSRVQTPPPRVRQRRRTIVPEDYQTSPTNHASPKNGTAYDDKENASSSRGRNGHHGRSGSVSQTSALKGSTPNAHGFNQQRPLGQAPTMSRHVPLTEQLRKRRMEGDPSLEIYSPAVKRRRVGRIALRPQRHSRRIISRPAISKRDREEREDRLLEEMNRKRVRKSDTATAPPVTAELSAPLLPVAAVPQQETGASAFPPIMSKTTDFETSTSVATPSSLSFGAPTAASTATTNSSATTTTTSSFTAASQFSAAPATTASIAAPPAQSQSSFSFGSTPAPSSTAPTAATPTNPSFNFGSTSSNNSTAAFASTPAASSGPVEAGASTGFQASSVQAPSVQAPSVQAPSVQAPSVQAPTMTTPNIANTNAAFSFGSSSNGSGGQTKPAQHTPSFPVSATAPTGFNTPTLAAPVAPAFSAVPTTALNASTSTGGFGQTQAKTAVGGASARRRAARQGKRR